MSLALDTIEFFFSFPDFSLIANSLNVLSTWHYILKDVQQENKTEQKIKIKSKKL